jgi:hypothetical protein
MNRNLLTPLRLLGWAGLATSPALMLWGLVQVARFSPLGLAFRADVVVNNDTTESVVCAIVGLAEGAGELCAAPRWDTGRAGGNFIDCRFQLKPRESTIITIDWDDIATTGVLYFVGGGAFIAPIGAQRQTLPFNPNGEMMTIGAGNDDEKIELSVAKDIVSLPWILRYSSAISAFAYLSMALIASYVFIRRRSRASRA